MLRYKWSVVALLGNAALCGLMFTKYSTPLMVVVGIGSVMAAGAYVWLGVTHVD